jgi:hypothetical protein
MDFHETIEASKQFHVMEPLVACTKQDESALQQMLGVLEYCELAPISLTTLKEMKWRGLMSCRCPEYLAYAWCIHSCVLAYERKVISKYPLKMNPSPTYGKKAGRFKKSKAGDALNIHG